MPRYRVTMPDGRTYTINGPAGASKEDVIAAVQRRIGAAAKEETTLGGELKEAVKGVIPGAAGLLETAATGAAALLPEEQEMAVRAKAAELAGAARETFAAAPGYEKSTGRKFGEALGSTVPFYALGPLGAAGRAAALGLGVGAGAGESRQRAEMEGGEGQKGLATAAGAVIGASEALPVFSFIKRLPDNVQLTMINRIRRALETAGEEGAQEAAQQIAQNFIAKGLYKPSQSLIESAGEEGAYGAGVGAFIQVLTDMALGRRARVPQPPPPTAEEKLTQPETPPTAPPGTQAAAREAVQKQVETKETVKQAISDEEDAQEEARRKREAIQAYERSVLEEDEELRRYYDEETLREAAEAERMAPREEDEGAPYMPPAAPAVEPIETREKITVPETVRAEMFEDSFAESKRLKRDYGEDVSKFEPADFDIPFVPTEIDVEGAVLPKILGKNESGRMTDIANWVRDTEYVPVSWLKSIQPGNPIDERHVQQLVQDLDKYGLNDPITITVGKENRIAKISEGNHRLEAARRLGYTHMPARVLIGDNISGGVDRATRKVDADLIPQAGEYFRHNTKPSNVFKSLAAPTTPSTEGVMEGLGAPTETVVEPAPAVEEPEYTMRDAALEVFKETGKTNVDTLRDRLAIPLQEAKALRQSLIDEGLLVRRGNTYILQEVKEAPPIKAAKEVTSAAPDIRAGDTETPDLGAVGRGDVLPAPQRVSTGLEAAEPAVTGVERVSEPPAVTDEREAGVEPSLKDVEELEAAQTPARPTSIRRAALDFVRTTGKADPISLQQALGIGLTDAKRLRDALVGSGAIVAVPGKKNFYTVFEELRTTPQEPFRAGRIEGESLTVAKPEVLQAAPRPAKKELPVDAAVEEAAVAQARQRREETSAVVEEVKSTIRQLIEAPGTQQYGLNLVGGEARGVTRRKLNPAEVNNAKTLGLDREAVAYANNPSDPNVRRNLLSSLSNKHKELLNRAVALEKLETSSRVNTRETTLKNSFFRNIYNNLRDPQLTMRDLVATENKLREGETKLGQRAAPEAAPTQPRVIEDEAAQLREAIERAQEREAAEKEQRKVRRLGRGKREIGLRFERGVGTGMDADLVYDIATKAAANWKNPPRIFVVQSISELPDTLRDRVPADATGFYINGDVFLIADNASNEAGVKSTLFHESLGHYGLKVLFGRRLREVMLDIYRTNPAMRRAVEKWLKKNPDTYNNLGRDNELAMAVEEVFAESSTQGVIKDAGIRAAFNRVAALIRRFVRATGIPVNYSNNDIRQILIEAHDSVTTKARRARLGDGTIALERKKSEDRLSKVFDVNLTAPKYDNKIGDGVRSALSNVYDSLREGAVSLMGVDHIAEVWAKELPAVAVLDNILGQRGATEMKRRENVSTNVTKWFELSNEFNSEQLDKFFRVANMTTIYQVDPLKASVQAVLKKPKSEMTPFDKVAYDIVKEFNAQDPRLRKAYADMRNEYESSAKEFEKLLEQRLGKDALDRIKSKYDQKKLEVYLPLWRDGQYWMTYTDPNGETISSAYASDVDRQRAKEAALAEGAKDIQEFSRLRDARLGAPPTGFLGDVVKQLEDNGVPPDAIDAVYEAYLNYLPAESVRQLRRPREASFDLTTGVDRYGVFGFEPDIFQSYANVAPRIANQLINLEYAIPLEETMKDLYKQTGGERVRDPMLAAVYRNLQKQVNFIRNPEKNWLVDGASYFSYLWFIAGNISSALINTTQLPMVVAPLLGGRYSYGKALAALDKAASTYFNGGWDSNNGGKKAFPSDFTFGATDNLDRKYKKLYDAAVSRSVIRRSTGYEITEAQKTGVKDFVGTRARVEHGLGWIFQNSERFNREVTLLAAFDLAYEETKDVNKAIEEAIKVVKAAHGSALAETGPRLFQQGFGKVMFTFKRFAQAQIYLLGKLFKQSFGDADPRTREIARSQLIGIFGSSFLIAGLQGMPLYGAVEFLTNVLLGDDDEPYDFNAYIEKKFGEFGRKGLLNDIINVDVASRTGFNGLLWRDDPKRMAEVGIFLHTLEQAMGPAYGAFLSGQRGIELFKEGEYQRAIEAIAPSFIRNGFKALRMAEEGVRNKDGTPVVENISDYNLMMQLVGFNPAEVAAARERAGVAAEFNRKLQDRRAKLINQYNAAWREGDQKELDEVWNKILDFNEANPQRGLRIDKSTLRDSLLGRSKRQLQSVDGLYLPMPTRARVNELTQE